MRLTDIGNDIITLRELLVLVCARAEGCWQVDGILFTSCWDECSGEVIQTEVDPVGNRRESAYDGEDCQKRPDSDTGHRLSLYLVININPHALTQLKQNLSA